MASKLGDPGEHKIKRRQSYREQCDLSSDEEVIFRKNIHHYCFREELTSHSDGRRVVLQC